MIPKKIQLKMDAALIEEVRKRPNLWKVKNKFYKTRSYQKHCYDQIAEALKVQFPKYASTFTGHKAMTDFKYLRYNYKREKKKAEKIKRESGCTDFTPIWVHFTQLQFLNKADEADESTSADSESQNVSLNNIGNSDEMPENVNLSSQSITSEATDSQEDSDGSQMDSGTENINEMAENVNMLSQSVISKTADSEGDFNSSQMDSDRENDRSDDEKSKSLQKKKKHNLDNSDIPDHYYTHFLNSTINYTNSIIKDAADAAFAHSIKLQSDDKSKPPQKKKKHNLDNNEITYTLNEVKRIQESFNSIHIYATSIFNDASDAMDVAFVHSIKLQLTDINDKKLKEKATAEIQKILRKHSLEKWLQVFPSQEKPGED